MSRDSTFTTKDGKRTLRICYVNGEPRAWITDALPDYQAQHDFAPGLEVQLCETFFKVS